jgi:hypothetical protein
MATRCKTCGGTGRIYSHSSWFAVDGYRRSICSICSGTGFSAYADDAHYARFQSEARAARLAAGKAFAG